MMKHIFSRSLIGSGAVVLGLLDPVWRGLCRRYGAHAMVQKVAGETLAYEGP